MVAGIGVLLLLSLFASYLLSPMVAKLRLRLRIGPRRRPPTITVAILIIYALLTVPVVLVLHLAADDVSHWVRVTAPESVDLLFGPGTTAPIDKAIARLPLPVSTQTRLGRQARRGAAYLERQTRETLDELIAAADYAWWLIAAPVFALLLLAGAPAFERSTLKMVPRGHMQWRAEAYLHDVNSALAGYVRAQAASGIIVGLECVCGFLLLGVPSAISMGVAAGVLELVPALGPLTAMLMATANAGGHVGGVLLFLVALRLVQDYIIYPRLVRQGMHLPTLAVILTLWFGAALAGAAGVILALPVAGFLTVSVRHWREYREIERLVRIDAKR
jgi:predicted PurR-regulated permease PerM